MKEAGRREKDKTTHVGPEKPPSVLTGMGGLGGLLVTFSIFGPILFMFGQAHQSPLPTALASFSGALSGVAYFLYKPLNPMSGNFYASKPFTRLTQGEARALGYLNGKAGSAIAVKAAASTAVFPLLGALSWQLGLHLAAKRNEFPYTSALWIGFGLSAAVSLTQYCLFVCRTLNRRWSWIVKNQPLPDRSVLSKYAKNERQLERLERRLRAGAEPPPGEEFDPNWRDALEGRLTWVHVRALLNVVGGGAALITAVRLFSGSVAPGRETGAILLLAVGGLIWFATLRRSG